MNHEPAALTKTDGSGMSATRLQAIDREFERRVQLGEASGYAIAISRRGKPVHRAAIGRQSIGGPAITQTTMFRIASMTKPVTAVAMLRLVEQGKLSLTDPVERYVPAIGTMQVRLPDGTKQEVKRPIQIRDLLTHISGIGYRFDTQSELGQAYVSAAPYEKAHSLEEAVAFIAQQDLFFQPGESFLYSYGLDVAGLVVQKVSGQPFEDFLEQEIFLPLGMKDTGFSVAPADADRLATVYKPGGGTTPEPAPGTVFGDPLDAGTWPSGGAGLISTAEDYLRFATMLERGGSCDGTQILSPASIALMTADHMPPTLRTKVAGTPLGGIGLGLGVAVTLDPGRSGALAAQGDYGWGGYYDTQFFISPRYDLAAVILTQREKAADAPDTDTLAVFKAMTLAAVIE
ncbi:MAG: serine hydrolase domain-containing protein [Parerythrobacter sp.]